MRKMRIKFYGCLVGLLVAAVGLRAQQSEYKVFYTSGTPQIIVAGKTVNLTRDAYIAKNCRLKIPAGSYVVLTNGKDIPMGFDPGDYSLSDLNKIYADVGKSNITEDFFTYIANNMIQEDKTVRRSGGVYRAVGDILIAPFDEAMIIKEQVTFHWKNPKKKLMYLKIYDIETWEQPYNIPVSDSVYTLKLDTEKLQKGRQYAWTIYHSADTPDQGTILRVFTFADDARVSDINKQLDDINKGENREFNKIKEVRLYLDNNIPIE